MAQAIKKHYNAYQAAMATKQTLKQQIKDLEQQGVQAATLAKKTPGTVEDKLAAIRTAWVPFNEKIATLNARIAQLEQYQDEEFDKCWSIK